MRRSVSLLLGLILAIIVSLVSVTPAFALTKTTLSAVANRSTWTCYVPVQLKCVLRDAANKPLAGQVVSLERNSDGVWRRVRTLRTSSQGVVTPQVKYRTTLTEKYAAQFRFRFLGKGALRGATSRTFLLSGRLMKLKPKTGSQVVRVWLEKGKALLNVRGASAVELTCDTIPSYRALLGLGDSTVSIPANGYYSFDFRSTRGTTRRVIVR